MKSGFIWLLPEEFLPLLMLGLGIGITLGLVTGRTVLSFIGFLIFLPFLGSIAGDVFSAVPPWIALVVIAIIVLAILRTVAAVVIGERAADTMTGNLAADAVRFGIRCCFLPFRMIGWMFRAMSGR